MDKAFCEPLVLAINSFCPYLRCSSPNNEATSKWRPFWCFRGFWANGSSIVAKKWLSQCGVTILWLSASVFGSYYHARRDTVPKVVLYSVLWSKYGRGDWNGSEQLCPPVIDSCALHKMLLVVFFHHRAFISLPQLSHSTQNTGLSRTSFSCLSRGDTDRSVPPWFVYIYIYISTLWLTWAVSNRNPAAGRPGRSRSRYVTQSIISMVR